MAKRLELEALVVFEGGQEQQPCRIRRISQNPSSCWGDIGDPEYTAEDIKTKPGAPGARLIYKKRRPRAPDGRS